MVSEIYKKINKVTHKRIQIRQNAIYYNQGVTGTTFTQVGGKKPSVKFSLLILGVCFAAADLLIDGIINPNVPHLF